MKKKWFIIPLFVGLSLTLSLPVIVKYNLDNISYAVSYSSRIEKYRQKAIENLTQLDLNEYRDEQADEISSLLADTIAKINNSDNYDEIDSFVSSYNRYVLTIKTDAQLTEEELEQVEDSDTFYISSLDELMDFRDDVNSGYSYKGDTVILTNDIVVPDGVNFGNSIGYTDDKPFSGVFDGGGHTISGLTLSGHDSIGLFSRVTDGTVKNLNMEDVDITATDTQRAAGVVARAKNATIQNVHVLSGTISGPKQNGGIVAIVVEPSAVIENCSNAASVTATSGNNAGIVGLVNNGSTLTITNCINTGNITGNADGTAGIIGGGNLSTANLYITNCVNRGAIVGSGNGTGGILGATGGGGTSVTVMTGCVNEGSVTGKAYVGGIAGILREGNKTTSLISECTNKGNISATSVGAGGISGIARVNVSDCMCLHTVTIKGNVANTLNAIGTTVSGTGGAGSTPGYIVGSAGNGASVTGKLINSDGSDY